MLFKLQFNRKTVFTRIAMLVVLGVMVVGFQGIAYAHFPIITASASCVNNAPVISYTASSWDPANTNNDGTNPDIQVLFDGAVVDTGAFKNPNFAFSNTLPAPAGTNEVDVQAVAAAPWGDGWPAGDVSSIVTVTIPTNCAPGTDRFTGGGKQVVINLVTGTQVAVTKGFEVDCDLHQPSNNLEINWDGNQFHMTDFTFAMCTLPGNPKPPVAPVNMIVGKGTGRYDQVDGYTVEFTLIDNGEPGTNDAAGFKIYETANPSNVVLNVAVQLITTGNIQAHVDQR
jgi:hypothetical protein